jgi:hypothetical protein
MSDNVFHGSLFSSDFLTESINRLADWSSIDDAAIQDLQTDLRKIYSRFPITKTPNESQTEDDLIWPILARLGWTASLRQQNLAARGRDDVPDGILFADEAAKAAATAPCQSGSSVSRIPHLLSPATRAKAWKRERVRR